MADELPKWRVWSAEGTIAEAKVFEAWEAKDAAELWGFDELLATHEEVTECFVIKSGEIEGAQRFEVEISIDCSARPARE